MSKRILITGGAGFIGSHLAERLLGRGDSVCVVDDLSTGRLENLSGVMGNPKFQYVRDTVENEHTVNLLVSQTDAIYHLAAAVGVKLVAEEPVRTIRTTIHGTEVVLEAAHRFGKPVLITSSSEVYGKSNKVPFKEDDDVLMGATQYSRWCYAYSKGIDEFLGLAYHKQYGLPSVMVRLFNTVGPRQVGMYGMVLPRFVEAALAGRDLQVYGDGSQTRCFSHVLDVVEAILKLMETPRAVGAVYNVGGEEEISINALAERVIAITGSKSKVVHVPYEKAYGLAFDDLPRRVPDLTKIRGVIGYSPRYNLDQIIKSVVGQWVR